MDYVLSGSVFITFDFVGLHRWLNAPREVAYLSHMHRHLFKVRVEVDVEHHDREIEFHMLKRDMVGKLMGSYAAVTGTSDLLLHESSCEQVALGIMDQLRLAYPDRLYYRVEVSEDGENGSIIEAQASPAVNSEEAAGNTVTSETGSSQGSPKPGERYG